MSKHKRERKGRGFVALMSVVIISAILLVLTYTLDVSSFFVRFDQLDTQSKHISLDLANACAHAAILKLAEGDYTAGTVVVDDSDPQSMCVICRITPSGDILTRARYNSAYTNLAASVRVQNAVYTIQQLHEIPSYSGPACVIHS